MNTDDEPLAMEETVAADENAIDDFPEEGVTPRQPEEEGTWRRSAEEAEAEENSRREPAKKETRRRPAETETTRQSAETETRRQAAEAQTRRKPKDADTWRESEEEAAPRLLLGEGKRAQIPSGRVIFAIDDADALDRARADDSPAAAAHIQAPPIYQQRPVVPRHRTSRAAIVVLALLGSIALGAYLSFLYDGMSISQLLTGIERRTAGNARGTGSAGSAKASDTPAPSGSGAAIGTNTGAARANADATAAGPGTPTATRESAPTAAPQTTNPPVATTNPQTTTTNLPASTTNTPAAKPSSPPGEAQASAARVSPAETVPPPVQPPPPSAGASRSAASPTVASPATASRAAVSPEAAPAASSRTDPRSHETIPATTISGSWMLTTELETPAGERMAASGSGYRFELKQSGGRVSGVARKVTEKGEDVDPALNPLLAVEGTFDGKRLILTLSRSRRSPGAEGKFVLYPEHDGVLLGRFSVLGVTGVVEGRRQ